MMTLHQQSDVNHTYMYQTNSSAVHWTSSSAQPTSFASIIKDRTLCVESPNLHESDEESGADEAEIEASRWG